MDVKVLWVMAFGIVLTGFGVATYLWWIGEELLSYVVMAVAGGAAIGIAYFVNRFAAAIKHHVVRDKWIDLAEE